MLARAARSSARSASRSCARAHVGRDRVARARTRRRACPGARPITAQSRKPVRSPFAVDEQVAEVRVAVHERALALAVHSAHDVVASARGRARRARRKPVGQAVGERRRRPSARTSRRRRRSPVACGASHARSPSGAKRGDSQYWRVQRARAARRCRGRGTRCRRRRAAGSGNPRDSRSSSTIT